MAGHCNCIWTAIIACLNVIKRSMQRKVSCMAQLPSELPCSVGLGLGGSVGGSTGVAPNGVQHLSLAAHRSLPICPVCKHVLYRQLERGTQGACIQIHVVG